MAIGTVRRAPHRPTLPSPGPGRAPRRRRGAVYLLLVVAIAVGGLVAAAFALSGTSLATDPVALARISTDPLAGSVQSVRAFAPDGRGIPLSVEAGRLTPRPGIVAPGERVSVQVVVRRPGALAWLLGSEQHAHLVVSAPAAQVARPRVTAPRAGLVPVTFDQPVRVVAYGPSGRTTVHALRRPLASITIPVHGVAGTVDVASALRSWERVGPPEEVTWFPPSRSPVAVASPAPDAKISPASVLRLTFSKPVAAVLGATQPTVTPTTPGRWLHPDAYTLAFVPSGAGAALGEHLRVGLPATVALVGRDGVLHRARNVAWTVRPGSTLRLHQLLAQAGYLPLAWRPAGAPVPRALAAEVRAAVLPPPGRFAWRYPNVPAPLRAMWRAGHANDITRGAVIAFESAHGLTADGFSGPRVWHALLADAIANRRTSGGYSYAYVHRDLSPQSLTLWHDGHTVLTTPANTGVAAAPTQLGTFPVFEHLKVTTMSGTNPGGSHYSDPGIKWVSYFNGGDAVHAFDRASFGSPQSVGCVELPLAAAATVWPYMPIGTLVTIEH